MFSKSKINEPESKDAAEERARAAAPSTQKPEGAKTGTPPKPAPKPQSAVSSLSSDLHITGNLTTTGDIRIDGRVDGDIRAHLLTVGDGAMIKGEVVADDVVIEGRIVGRVRGLKVRLTSTAQVEGGVDHKVLAIESGAHLDGAVQHEDDPLKLSQKDKPGVPSAGKR